MVASTAHSRGGFKLIHILLEMWSDLPEFNALGFFHSNSSFSLPFLEEVGVQNIAVEAVESLLRFSFKSMWIKHFRNPPPPESDMKIHPKNVNMWMLCFFFGKAPKNRTGSKLQTTKKTLKKHHLLQPCFFLWFPKGYKSNILFNHPAVFQQLFHLICKIPTTFSPHEKNSQQKMDQWTTPLRPWGQWKSVRSNFLWELPTKPPGRKRPIG